MVGEDAGVQSAAGSASNISAGTETGQSLSFIVSDACPSIFTQQPQIDLTTAPTPPRR